MSDCLFCRIAAGEISAQRVAESAEAIAFRDIDPQAPTHVLVIPRRHVAESAAELGPQHAAMLADLFALAARVARDQGLQGGFRIVTNVGPDAGQSVPHLHLHVLGGRAMRWPPG